MSYYYYFHLAAKDCGDPGEGVNATKSGIVNTYGNTVVYSCLTGYEASMGNTHVLQCQSNGTWNGTALACTGRAFSMFWSSKIMKQYKCIDIYI